MRWALLSDIHSNLEALVAVLRDLEKRAVDRICFLGDLVGYGASPNECAALARSSGFTAILGNHDRAVLSGRKLPLFTHYARRAVEWTQAALSAEHRNYLASWPVTMGLPPAVLVHGALTGSDHYILSGSDIPPNLDLLKAQHPEARILLFGHSHIRCFFTDLDPVNRAAAGCEYDIPDNRFVFINPGSVGQPGMVPRWPPTPCWICPPHLYTAVHCLDVRTAQEKIIAAGLPAFLAERLAGGL
jgi:predicted phosphodiesterase